MQRGPWRNRARLSSVADGFEAWLATTGFDRGPWVVVAFAVGIVLWFVLASPAEWIFAVSIALITSLGAVALWKGRDDRIHLRQSLVVAGLAITAGVLLIWTRSEVAGARAIERPVSTELTGRILDRIDQPAENRVRLVLATREPASSDAPGGRAIKVRVNIPMKQANAAMTEGATVRLRARLMPPASPMLPGGYDFARAAWFQGLAATGSVQGPVEVKGVGSGDAPLAALKRRLSEHVRSNLPGSPGAIAAAFASGDRGAIDAADDDAMRDSGLTHLLSVSGLHVSAVIGLSYLLAMRLLALWPWLALRVRLPLAAAAVGALAGIGYTLLTGAEVPTVRSCIGALLVLIALALGREPLSLRMLAAAAFAVLLLWPESLAGPSFQMSFTAVLAIVALHGSAPVRSFLAPREEGVIARGGRRLLMLLATGVAIELALMPIVLFHFHKAGLYGALANVIAIPLVTFISMPLIALALLLDVVGVGAPVWWAAGKSLDVLLAIAHFTAAQPGAVTLVPQMTGLTFALFVGGVLWLAMWRGKARLLGLVPTTVAAAMLLATPIPDMLISGDGRQVGVITDDGRLLTLRETRSDFTRENLLELAGVAGEPVPLDQWPEAECSPDFCVLSINRAGRTWHILMSRSAGMIEERALAAACERADIVVSDRWLPRSCRARWIRADGRSLAETGGMAILLDGQKVRTVAASQGQHGWWRGRDPQ